MRGWRLVALAVAVVLGAAAVAFVVADDGDDGSSVATGVSRPTTTSSALSETTTTASPSESSTSAPASTVTTRSSRATTTVPAAAVRPSPPPPVACAQPAPGSDFDGFGATEIVIENAAGAYRSCVVTADTPEQQQQGLMHQDDIDSYSGMIFRFAREEHRTFWMRNTRIPLSIAFFDANGAFVSAADMEPCGDSPDCPRYISNGPAQFALEVSKGQLASVGATAGSRLTAR